MNTGPYNPKPNYFNLDVKIDKIEECQESKNGTMYRGIWFTRHEYYNDNKIEHHYKGVLFNDAALNIESQVVEGMWVRVEGKLRGSNHQKDEHTYNQIELRISNIEPLSANRKPDIEAVENV